MGTIGVSCSECPEEVHVWIYDRHRSLSDLPRKVAFHPEAKLHDLHWSVFVAQWGPVAAFFGSPAE